jgi:HD-like signal output (HDOD) protein/ActR/RegA family two-component response regulator
MSPGRYRALVVDNDVALGQLAVAALSEHGFACDIAADGNQAGRRLAGAAYDVVIVDLKMPNQQGQALVRELIERENRPIVIVYSDAVEPKAAQELINRGVDGVLSRPVDFDFLATKARSLVDRRQRRPPLASNSSSTSGVSDGRVSPALFNEKLAHVSHVLPISAAALDVYEMTKNLEWDLSQIAAAVQRDAALTTEVLRMANSSYYNPPGRPIVDLDEAVMRIGQRRVGELALSINALSSVTPAKIPWMDLQLLWNRSMAAGIALELLVELGSHEEVADGLFVSAIMHPLGRIVLGMLFPEQYSPIVAECVRTGKALEELERQTFPASHSDVMAHLLADWRIAPEVFIPLKFSLDEYSSLARLLEPMRTKAELVKVAIFLGRLAVGRWESWDLVRFPPASVLDRLGVREVEQLVRQTRSDVSRLAEFHPGGKVAHKKAVAPLARQTVAYCNFSGHGVDLVKEFLPALGLEVQSYTASDLRLFGEPLVANCLGVEPMQFAAQRTNNISTIVTEAAKCQAFARFAPSIGLPNSFSRVREQILAQVAANACEPAAG